MSAPAFFARWRVRLGYPLAIVVLILARPTPQSIFYGALVGAVGLLVRAMAAGHLHKQSVLTVTGPYAYTRNPLYFGSAILTLGAAIATHSWISAILLLGYFALFYSIVMRREERELRFHHGASFDEYARAGPGQLTRKTRGHLLLRPIQKEPRIPGRRRVSAVAACASGNLAIPLHLALRVRRIHRRFPGPVFPKAVASTDPLLRLLTMLISML